jgi:hypothetical protein
VRIDVRKGNTPIAEELQYNWHGLHYLHTLVRCFATGAGIHASALGSFLAIRVQDEGLKMPSTLAISMQRNPSCCAGRVRIPCRV